MITAIYVSSPIFFQNLCDTIGAMHDNLRFTERSLHRLGCSEDFGEFFEGATAGFDIKKVDECELEHVPEDEEKVVLRSG
jgi:hypothetical protein